MKAQNRGALHIDTTSFSCLSENSIIDSQTTRKFLLKPNNSLSHMIQISFRKVVFLFKCIFVQQKSEYQLPMLSLQYCQIRIFTTMKIKVYWHFSFFPKQFFSHFCFFSSTWWILKHISFSMLCSINFKLNSSSSSSSYSKRNLQLPTVIEIETKFRRKINKWNWDLNNNNNSKIVFKGNFHLKTCSLCKMNIKCNEIYLWSNFNAHWTLKDRWTM